MGRRDPDLVSRQARVAVLAFDAFGSMEAARAFLNAVDAELGGRPIDIAGASIDGLRAVEAAIGAARSTHA